MRILLTLWRENESLRQENERLRQERDEFARAILTYYFEPCGHHGFSCRYCGIVSKAHRDKFPHKPDCIVLKADAIKKQMEDEK